MLTLGPHSFHPNTIPGLLHRRAIDFPDHPCYLFPESDQKCTWSGLWEDVKAVAAGFTALGVRKGDRIAILMEGRAELLVSIYAAIAAGAVAVPLNTYLTRDELKVQLQEAKPTVFIMGSAAHHLSYTHLCDVVASSASGEVRDAAWLPVHSFVQHDGGYTESPFRNYHDLKKEPSCPESSSGGNQPFTSGDPAFLLFTSGTTGKPKGISRSLASFMTREQAERGKRRNKVTSLIARKSGKYINRFSALSLLPLYHLGGIGMALTSLHVCNVKMVMLTRFNPVKALAALSQSGTSFLIGTPYMIQAMMKATPAGSTCLDSTLGIIFTSAALERNVIQNTVKAFRRLYFFMVSYGSTETGGVANGTCFLNNKCNVAVSILLRFMRSLNYINGEIAYHEFAASTASIGGKIARNVEVGIRDLNTGQWLSQGEQGEIMIRSHRLMPRPGEHTDAHFFSEDGWFRSGDIGYVDKRDIIMITGRLKRLISRGGEKIAPAEIEHLIRHYPGVEDALVLGLPDELYGERIYAVFTEQPDTPVSVAQLSETLRSSLSSFKVPEHFICLPSFPLTASGKIAEDEIRRRLMVEIAEAYA